MYERYVELRNQKGVSDYRVAKDTGIPKSTFSDWKSGRSKPKIAKLKILAGYFDVAVDELISATDETGSEEGREKMTYLRIASFILAILGIVFSIVNMKERY